jgi:hypothetical protein
VQCPGTVPYTGRKSHGLALPAFLDDFMSAGDPRLQPGSPALLPKEHRDTQRVCKVGGLIVQAACKGLGGGSYHHISNKSFEFCVLDAPAKMVFTNASGRIFITMGMLDMLTDTQLAAVLAHEVAHVLARHPAERMACKAVALPEAMWALLQDAFSGALTAAIDISSGQHLPPRLGAFMRSFEVAPPCRSLLNSRHVFDIGILFATSWLAGLGCR